MSAVRGQVTQLERIKHKMMADTREKIRLEFSHPDIACTIKKKLCVGDYCILFSDNSVPPVHFERKSVGDLFGTLTGSYDRFKSEIIRSREADITLILIIEGTFSKVLKGYDHSDPRNPGTKIHMDGLRIIRTLFSLYVRYNVVPVFCKDREEMQNYIIEYYLAIWRKRQGLTLKKGKTK